MNVILLEKIGKLGEIGDTANVKAGYARNFLFPQGKAIQATKENLSEFEQRKAELMAAHDSKLAEAQRKAKKVEGASLRIEVNASDEGKLFGSVGTRDIAEALNSQNGSDIIKSQVIMPHGAIRELGEYQVNLDLGYDINVPVQVTVTGLKSAAEVSDDGSIIEEIEEAEAVEKAESAAETESETTDQGEANIEEEHK
ncbi:MAG: 50S ribosomal protein L9 [Gammaproteobacteria bacterium]|nr:50S ribosomal protein L9 [Gammaproteobacteria bacterium]HAC87796.1 50S ribosomal protein L9 [Gammaproteobacteria bacterium]HAD72299.1 50S ribosomal protein L9 [Gammaproteobacteria bacterium]|tara:strand:- start:332 stop:925 length:594 start_codon:yes stop_codon:yes gene_type:complete